MISVFRYSLSFLGFDRLYNSGRGTTSKLVSFFIKLSDFTSEWSLTVIIKPLELSGSTPPEYCVYRKYPSNAVLNITTTQIPTVSRFSLVNLSLRYDVLVCVVFWLAYDLLSLVQGDAESASPVISCEGKSLYFKLLKLSITNSLRCVSELVK